MEHLPALSCQPPKHLRVPYYMESLVPHPGFDDEHRHQHDTSGPEFWEYPGRLGWSTEGLRTGLLGNCRVLLSSRPRKSFLKTRSHVEFAAILQHWWYFGLLAVTINQRVEHDDFLKHDPVDGLRKISTESLQDVLHDWQCRLATQKQEEIFEQLKQAKSCIDYVCQRMKSLSGFVDGIISDITVNDMKFYSNELEELCLPKDVIDDRTMSNRVLAALLAEDRRFWKTYGRIILPRNLELSICILGHTLRRAVYLVASRLRLTEEISLQREELPWYTPEFLLTGLARTGVCPKAAAVLHPQLTLIGMLLSYFLSSATKIGDSLSHADCLPSRCNIDYLADGKYERQHVPPNCECRDLPPTKSYDQVMGMLERGEVPILCAKQNSQNQVSIEVRSATEYSYVAVSHIWSDGLGNEETNQISQCQWMRLQGMVDEFIPKTHRYQGALSFWLDTICVPVVPKSALHLHTPDHDRRKRLRNYAIERMRDTYRNAAFVLIIDSTMLKLNLDELSDIEFGLIFSHSRWMQRLWTMHEGAVARNGSISIQTASGQVELGAVLNRLVLTNDRAVLSRQVSLLSTLGVTEAYMPWAFNISVLPDDLQQSRQEPYMLFRYVWNQSRNRATKYLEDRYVVIASLLGIGKPQNLYDCETEEAQMLYLFKHFDKNSIPTSVIFAHGQRLTVPGYRWAPCSIDDDILDVSQELTTSSRTEKGLIVELHGWKLHPHPKWNRQILAKFSGTGTGQGCCPFKVSFRRNARAEAQWLVHCQDEDAIAVVRLVDEKFKMPLLSEEDFLYVIRNPFKRKGNSADRAVLLTGKGPGQDGLIDVRYLTALLWTDLHTDEHKLYALLANYVQICEASPVGDTKTKPKWCFN